MRTAFVSLIALGLATAANAQPAPPADAQSPAPPTEAPPADAAAAPAAAPGEAPPVLPTSGEDGPRGKRRGRSEAHLGLDASNPLGNTFGCLIGLVVLIDGQTDKVIAIQRG